MPTDKEHKKKDLALAPQDLAGRFKLFRNLKNVSQRDMAELLGISQSGIAEYEAAKRSIPVETLQALHNAYGLNYQWFFTGTGKPDDMPEEKTMMTDVKGMRDDIRMLKLKIMSMDKQLITLVRELYTLKHS